MTDAPPAALVARRPTGADHARVLLAQETWWGGLGGEAGAQQRAFLLPRLFFQHFADTSTLLEGADGDLRAFLIGFVSQSQPAVAYIHFVGVDPGLRRQGVARWLYERFFAEVAARGARRVRCVTSPSNRTSQAFHTGIGFEIDPGETIEGVEVQRDYDGPGVDRVTFTRRLDRPGPGATDPVCAGARVPITRCRGSTRDTRYTSAVARFVIQQHDATTLHFDLRLEIAGVLRSWAVPKGPSLDPKVRRLAVPVPDHSLAAGEFEGVHEGARRGSGAVIVWDEGTVEIATESRTTSRSRSPARSSRAASA